MLKYLFPINLLPGGFFISIILHFKTLSQLPIYIYALSISLVASIFILPKKDVPRYLKLFPLFLFMTLVVELIGATFMARNNAPLYNFITIFEFVFYLYIIKEIIHNRGVKNAIIALMILYPILALSNIFFVQRSIYRWHVTTYSVGCLAITLCCIYYFFELFNSNVFVNLKREPAFWIITGLLFFYTCSFPIFGFANFISGLSVIAKNIGAVLVIINVILYILFAVGFLCRMKFTS